MSEKKCSHHGFLPIEQWLICGKFNEKPQLKCKLCRHETYRNNYLANKEKILIRSKKWRDGNPEKRREYHKREKEKYREKLSSLVPGIPLSDRKKVNIVLRKLSNLIIAINEAERAAEKFKRAKRYCF